VCLFRCSIFIGFRIIKGMPGSVGSGTPYIYIYIYIYTHIYIGLYIFMYTGNSFTGGKAAGT